MAGIFAEEIFTAGFYAERKLRLEKNSPNINFANRSFRRWSFRQTDITLKISNKLIPQIAVSHEAGMVFHIPYRGSSNILFPATQLKIFRLHFILLCFSTRNFLAVVPGILVAQWLPRQFQRL